MYSIGLPRGGELRLGERTLVMGVLNVTPDSFALPPSSSGRVAEPAAAVDAALEMIAAGADLIDIGGESTRPGAEPVTADEEMRRVLPVIERLALRAGVPLSVDTYKASVAAAALDAGASIVNDISGLQYDPDLAGVAVRAGAPIVLMHMRGTPASMYSQAHYADVVSEVTAELRAAILRATTAGVALEQIIVDPGLGFAKRAGHSYGVLARLQELAAALDRPLLVGASRKSFLRAATGDRPASERDWATAAAVTAAVLGGACIVRVHAVAEMVQVARVADEIRRHRSSP